MKALPSSTVAAAKELLNALKLTMLQKRVLSKQFTGELHKEPDYTQSEFVRSLSLSVRIAR